ncbi:MAG: TVP38/TMEM64 family protein [Clostridia bacterium]|nr:TVP38/TMEM64 family protein [Clostridia bacterium]
MPVQTKKRIVLGLMLLIAAVFGLVFWFVGRPMVEFVSQPELFRQWVDQRGLWGNLAFLGMTVLQVVVAFVPGEPLELAAGYAFGFWEGTLLCVLGILIGSSAVFFTVRRFGRTAVELFFPAEKIDSLRFLQNKKRLLGLTFLLFFIPGTPKDLLTYFVGLTPIKPLYFLLIACLARLPSVITSTLSGHAFGDKDYLFAVILLACTVAISLLGMLIYRKITAYRRRKQEEEERPKE